MTLKPVQHGIYEGEWEPLRRLVFPLVGCVNKGWFYDEAPHTVVLTGFDFEILSPGTVLSDGRVDCTLTFRCLRRRVNLGLYPPADFRPLLKMRAWLTD